jgi:phosphoglucomutase
VLDLDAIRGAGVRIGADPLGGASVDYWGRSPSGTGSTSPSSTRGRPDLRFMTLDWDGKIRMDCSSPYAMAR